MKGLVVYLIIGAICCNPMKEITKIEIRKVDFEITSIISIGCDNFEEYFKEEFRTVTIDSNQEIMVFANHLESMESDSEGYIPDVRAKLLIYYSNDQVDTLCMSDLGMLYNGKPMLISQHIKQFVESH